MAERWVPTLGYELVKVVSGGAIHVVKRGGLHVKEGIPDDEIMYRTIAVATDYDEGVRVVRALRAALERAGDG